jgi:hypothetical protein
MWQELTEWSVKLLEKMHALPQLADVSSDLLASAPQLRIMINRNQASPLDGIIAAVCSRCRSQRKLRIRHGQDVFRCRDRTLRDRVPPPR